MQRRRVGVLQRLPAQEGESLAAPLPHAQVRVLADELLSLLLNFFFFILTRCKLSYGGLPPQGTLTKREGRLSAVDLLIQVPF